MTAPTPHQLWLYRLYACDRVRRIPGTQPFRREVLAAIVAVARYHAPSEVA